MAELQTAAGLRGVVAGRTAICTVGGGDDSLRFRGYDVAELAEHATFEEVAFLLLYGELPTHSDLEGYLRKLRGGRKLPAAVLRALELIPAGAHPMDVMRIGCSMLGAIEPEGSFANQDDAADRLLAALPSILGYWRHWTARGQRIDPATDQESIAGQVIELLTESPPTEEHRRFMDASLILYSEHEFNASTFTARTIAAAWSDLHSAVSGAMGALGGTLHGGANEAAMKLISRFKTPDKAAASVREMLARKERVMGFGHAVYRGRDPRNAITKRWAKRLSRSAGDGYLYAVSEEIEASMAREKGLFANVDFYMASAYHFVGIEPSMFTPLFAVARTAGWCAHIKEQRRENKLIHPLAEYVGPPPRAYKPLDER